eukprot:GCRY01003159.1.p1 GENE.GCRY01003159.1~~GCRY01003159.1.p1  ORF type:complete len:479 (+),score=110.68 GCRY01003159.1:72-1508(+)
MKLSVFPFKSALSRLEEINPVIFKVQRVFERHHLPIEMNVTVTTKDGNVGCGTSCSQCGSYDTAEDDCHLIEEAGSCDNVYDLEKNLDTIKKDAVLCALILTGGTEDAVIKAVEQSEVTAVLLLTHPNLNSLPAALEIAAYCRARGVGVVLAHFSTQHLRPTSQPPEALVSGLNVFFARSIMNSLRLGVIGQPSDWLILCKDILLENHVATIKRIWGPTLVPVDLQELIDNKTVVASEKTEKHMAEEFNAMEAKDWQQKYAGLIQTGEIEKNLLVYRILKTIIRHHNLDAVTVRCFDLLKQRITGCLALSRLNDEGVVAGCEGDVHAALTMILAQSLLKAIRPNDFLSLPTFMANPVDYDLEKGEITFAHCTIPTALCAQYVLRTHFESDLGIAVQGDIKPFEHWTIARVDALSGKVFHLSATPVPTQPKEHLCRTQITLHVGPVGVEQFRTQALGNHHILIPHNLSAEIALFHELYL